MKAGKFKPKEMDCSYRTGDVEHYWYCGASNGSFNYFCEAHALRAIFINESIQGLEFPDLIKREPL